jgi:hypothetical protein
MEVSDYLKADSQKNIIYYLLPGVIAFWPYSIIFFRYFRIHLGDKLSDYLIYSALIFFVLSMGLGTLIEDIGGRVEMWLDDFFQKTRLSNSEDFDGIWNEYLIIKIPRTKEPPIMRYYRTILLRLKFELHTIISIILMLVGHSLLNFLYPGKIDWVRTLIYLATCVIIIGYLLYEAYKGVDRLHDLRTRMLNDFNENKEYYMKT